MALHNKLGKEGETIATEYLITQGYTIRETNWHMNRLEIDIVAEHDNRIVIVEVKTRSTNYVDPLDAIDKKKIMNLVHAADTYIRCNNLPQEVQFDVISLIGKDGNFKIEHIPDAFRAPLKSYQPRFKMR
ncbi:MAG: YraN family protein [Muribaculaceae bacterium]|jgi:putative endonuclease|nr:YraN family protein [Muribaculaceae bacterium]